MHHLWSLEHHQEVHYTYTIAILIDCYISIVIDVCKQGIICDAYSLAVVLGQ